MTALMLLILNKFIKWHRHYEKTCSDSHCRPEWFGQDIYYALSYQARVGRAVRVINAIKVTHFADRAYFYDNSIDNQNAQLLFRTVDGNFAKQYVEALPQWTNDIIESIK